jgi:hypothetical protein
MPFPRSLKDQVLVKSRRSCCICHRFLGVNIEVHHIKQESEGGSDEEDNAIPLCFDCHANVGHYDAKHPKGTKFGESELKLHRENWYAKVADAGIAEANLDHKKIDVRIASEIHEHLTREGSFIWMRDDTIWNGIENRVIKPLWDLCYKLCNRDYHFMDADLESARAHFASALDEAVDRAAKVVSPSKQRPDWYTVGPSIYFEDPVHGPEKTEEIDDTDKLFTKAASTYEDLYNLVRQKLGLDLRF